MGESIATLRDTNLAGLIDDDSLSWSAAAKQWRRRSGPGTYLPIWGGAYTFGNSTNNGFSMRIAGSLYWFYAELIAGSTWSGNVTDVSLPSTVATSTILAQWFRWSGNNNNIGGTAFGFGGSSSVTFRFVASTTNNLDQTITLASTDHLVVTGHYYST